MSTMLRYAQEIRLPKDNGVNASWRYLQTIAGKEFIRRQCNDLIKTRTYFQHGRQIQCNSLPRNNETIAFIRFNNAILTVNFLTGKRRENHFGMVSRLAGIYCTPDAQENLLCIRRYNKKEHAYYAIKYEIFVTLQQRKFLQCFILAGCHIVAACFLLHKNTQVRCSREPFLSTRGQEFRRVPCGKLRKYLN